MFKHAHTNLYRKVIFPCAERKCVGHGEWVCPITYDFEYSCEKCPHAKIHQVEIIDYTAPLIVYRERIKEENNRFYYIHSLLKKNYYEEYNEMIKKYGVENCLKKSESQLTVEYKCYFDNYEMIKNDLV